MWPLAQLTVGGATPGLAVLGAVRTHAVQAMEQATKQRSSIGFAFVLALTFLSGKVLPGSVR